MTDTPAISHAFVLGAGLGTRLRSLTDRLPKPLIPIFNKPLITFGFDQLTAAGVRHIVVNTHHCPQAYAAAFPQPAYGPASLAFIHEPVLLETAGGIKNAEPRLYSGPFIVYNGDILASIPLGPVIAHHRSSGNEVTMVLRSHGHPLHVSLLDNGRIADIAGRLGRPGRPCLFTGIYIIEPSFLSRIPPRSKISVIPIFMDMIQDGAPLGGIIVDEGQWWDLGTREKYLEVHAALASPALAAPLFQAPGWPTPIHPSASVSPQARLSGFLAAGPGAVIEPGAQVTDCILWDGARVLAGSHLTRCIVTAGRTASGTATGADF